MNHDHTPALLNALQNLLKRAELGLNQTATHDGLENCDALAAARAAIRQATKSQQIRRLIGSGLQ